MTAAAVEHAAASGGRVMTLVSVTRFRLRAIRFAPFFTLHANRTIAQIRKADGFVAGAVRRDAGLAEPRMTHGMRL